MCRIIFIEKACPMKEYIAANGYHFNAKLLDFALGHLKNRNGSSRRFSVKDVLKVIADGDGSISEEDIYDVTYLANWLYSDLYPDIISTEALVVKAACLYPKDPDGYDGQTLFRWVDDARRRDIDIPWNDMV